jgi:putative ABC transport system ATP-binding protein
MGKRKDPHAEWRPGAEDAEPEQTSRLQRVRANAARAVTVPGRRLGQAAASREAVMDETRSSATGPETSTGPLLAGEDLVRTYPGAQGVTALHGVTLTVSSGEFVALLGPSGSGKTTLLGLLSGLDIPERGRVCWLGTPVQNLGHDEVLELRRAGIGVVFQGFGLLPSLSAVENVALPLRVAGETPEKATGAAEAWLERLGMADRFDNRVFELSAGQQQRVAVARALVIEPQVVLADEPIAEVDTTNASVILEALSEVSGRGGAVVCATHNPVALGFATRVVLLRDGAIEAEGTPAEVAVRLTTD